jgi:hypothetical protein
MQNTSAFKHSHEEAAGPHWLRLCDTTNRIARRIRAKASMGWTSGCRHSLYHGPQTTPSTAVRQSMPPSSTTGRSVPRGCPPRPPRRRRPRISDPGRVGPGKDGACLDQGSSPGFASCLLALPRHEPDSEIVCSLTLLPRSAERDGISACARRSDTPKHFRELPSIDRNRRIAARRCVMRQSALADRWAASCDGSG